MASQNVPFVMTCNSEGSKCYQCSAAWSTDTTFDTNVRSSIGMYGARSSMPVSWWSKHTAPY